MAPWAFPSPAPCLRRPPGRHFTQEDSVAPVLSQRAEGRGRSQAPLGPLATGLGLKGWCDSIA